ncbi:hypothetical protein BDV36DRAFT_280286 [Aspergillus pseudocaelatus]|uniref:Uncharacterized protein n=1 Tax=Aspergillus pseudocaelatus TaxID=1825620 RepID=A0ABQ6WY13_9EURO|nr:hypothetical protein BDV36DRAFT_280286 [Aspergillus pseudocaelatus]
MSTSGCPAQALAIYLWNCYGQEQPDNPIKDGYVIDIGTDDFAEVRWWAAIHAEGRGWQATLTRHGKDSPFRLHHRAQVPSSTSTVNTKPPTSAQAQEYLFNLARYHDAFDQLISALAATMTISLYNRFGASITLPLPKPENHIPCNLVSQWLNLPMREIFPALIRSKKYHAIVCAMAQRRPNTSPLWLGALITGLVPRIFQVCRSYLPTVYLEAVTWTASPQSFMDPQYYRLTPVHKTNNVELIPREDKFRLLFITDVDSETYRTPLSPYRPFGLVELQNTSIEVRLHYSCNHQLSYCCWNWRSVESSIDPNLLTIKALKLAWMAVGFPYASLYKPPLLILAWAPIYRKLVSICFWHRDLDPTSPLCEELDKEEEVYEDTFSELATRNIFSWTFFTEGTRPEQRELWKHEWLELLRDRDDGVESSESSSSEVGDEANKEKLQHVQTWRDTIAAQSDDMAKD